ncbi:MAG: exodeoxyribonuclease VII small subunit [Coraliomargarita sp.]|nr:exodeoxyribonuclease VII small subunit [Coraliomargarita sp.]
MPKKTETTPSFEDAMERLEALITAMEEGDTPLADMVAKFEEGSKLLKMCQTQLKAAELKIEKLNLDSGEVELLDDDSVEA